MQKVKENIPHIYHSTCRGLIKLFQSTRNFFSSSDEWIKANFNLEPKGHQMKCVTYFFIIAGSSIYPSRRGRGERR